MNQHQRTNGSVSPAQMDTTEYPPEGQNAECDTWLHEPGLTADDRASWYNYCPKCGEKL